MDRAIKKKRFTPKKIITVTLAAAFVIVVAYSFIFGDRSSKLNVKVERITISTVTEGPFTEFIPVLGTVRPITTQYLSADQGGRVEVKYVEPGIMVKKGDPLIKLENTDLVLNLMNREAEVFREENALRNTRLDMERRTLQLRSELANLDYQIAVAKNLYERNKRLIQENLISQQEFEQSKENYDYLIKNRRLTILSQKQDSLFRMTQIKQLEANLERMRANLEIVRKNQEKLTIRAPISGHLTSLNAEIGETKMRGQLIGQIDVLDGFKVEVPIDEHYLARIETGLKGSFDFSGKTYDLILSKIYPEILEGRFRVDMQFTDEEPEGIRRGQTLHIRLNLGDLSQAVLLPRGGFYQKTGGQWIYVVDKSGDFAYKRRIRLGRYNTQVYEVLEGLEPGEKVITSSYDSYGDIDKLILKN